MAFRVAKSILTLSAQLQREAPAAKPPATDINAWGTIGDSVHDPTSDHAAKNFPGWGSSIVTAGDFPNAPALGLNIFSVFDSIRRARDPRVKYMISNDKICSSYATSTRAAWTWGPYNPSDPRRDRHIEHGHLSVVGDARADGTQPWATGLGEDEDDMGQSFGPTQLNREGATSFTIPPVQAGTADPREVWINIGGDLGGDAGCRIRIFGSDGAREGKARPYSPIGNGDGLHTLYSGEVLSIGLPKGLRTLSVQALGLHEGDAAPTASISVCFERK